MYGEGEEPGGPLTTIHPLASGPLLILPVPNLRKLSHVRFETIWAQFFAQTGNRDSRRDQSAGKGRLGSFDDEGREDRVVVGAEGQVQVGQVLEVGAGQVIN